METGVVIIQEPVFTKTSVEEAVARVVHDQSTMEVDKVNQSTVLDDEITSRDCGETDVAEVINGSGNKETEESKDKKEEAMKTISVAEEDSKIVKEKATDAKIISSDVILEKVKEDDITRKPEELISEKPVAEEEDQTENKQSQEQEKDTGNISKILVDTAPVKSGEDDINSAPEEIPIKTAEVNEEKDSRTVDNSVNGKETEHNATVSVEETSSNGENIMKETATEQETEANMESMHDVESTKRVLLEAEKEAEPWLDAKEKDETEIVNNEETRARESESLKGDNHQRESAEPVEPIKQLEDAEQISHELEEDTRKTEEAQNSPKVTETRTVQGEDIESEAPKDTEKHEHVLVRDIPQDETVNTSTVQASAVLKTSEIKSDETDTEPSLDLKEDKEPEEEETVKTVTPSDEVQESITVIEPPKTSPDQRSKDTEEDENVLGRSMPQGDIFVTEAESLVAKEDSEEPIMERKEDKAEKSEEIPSDLVLKVDKEELKDVKIKVDQVAGVQTMEPQRGLGMNESEAEQTDRNRVDETEETPVEKLVAHQDVESAEQMEKQSIESPSEVSEEISKTLDEKIEAKSEEEVPPHQEGQEEGSYGSETKEENVSVPESSELGEKAHEERSLDLSPLQEESCQAIEQDKETKLQKEPIHKHEPANEEVKSASPSEEREGETVVEAKKIEEIKANEHEQVAEKIQKSLEIVEKVDNEPVKSNDDKAESLSSTHEEIQVDETAEANEEKASRTAETEDEHNAMVSEVGISGNIVNQTAADKEEQVEAIKKSDDAEIISHEVTGDKEKEEDITEAEDVNTSIVQETAILKTLETTVSETEVSQETKKDIELSFDMKDGKEEEETESAKTVISSEEARPSGQVDVQDDESVTVKPKETLQDESNENLLDVPSAESNKSQVNEPETESRDKFEDIPSGLVSKVDNDELKDDKTEVDKVDGTQVMGEQRGLEHNELEVKHIDLNKADEAEETSVVEEVERKHSSSIECPSQVSAETNTTVDEKIEEKLQEEEEVTLDQEEASNGLPESRELGEKAQEEESCLPKETNLEKELIEKHEPVDEVRNDPQSHVEEKSDEVIQDSSASLSEEREGGTVVDAEKIEGIKANEEEQVADKIQKSFETVEITEPQSSLPSYSKEQEQEIVSEKIEDEKVKEEEPIVQISSEDDATKSHERQDEVHKTGETTAVLGETKANEFAEDDKLDEHVDSQTEAKKGGEEITVRDIQQGGETIVTEAAVSNTLETTINESEAVHTPTGGEVESQVTKEDTKPILDLKEDEEQEETETVKTVILSDEVIKDESQGREECVELKPKEIVQHESTQEKDENLLDVPNGESADEKMQRPSLESPSELSEETSKTVDEKIEGKPEEQGTLQQESQEEDSYGLETKEETVSVPESSEPNKSCLPNEQEKETKLQKEQTSEEDSNAHQTPVEEKTDEIIQVEAEKIEEAKVNEEHENVAEAEKLEDRKVKETKPMGDISARGLEISETKDLTLPLETSGLDGTDSTELVAESEEQNPKQVKEILEGENVEVDEKKTEELPSTEKVPQETLSDVVTVQMKREDDATESHERQEELSKAVETTVSHEEKTGDMEKGETETKEPEHETLVAETKKEDEDKKVSLDGSGTSKTSKDVCIKQEDSENVVAPKQEESNEEKRQEVSETIEATRAKGGDHTLAVETSEEYQNPPSFIAVLEDKVPTQIEEIHEEETEEAEHKLQVVADQSLLVETLLEDQTPSLLSESNDQTLKQTEEILRTEESVGETKPNESEPERTGKSDENSSKVTKVEDENTKGQSMSLAPENASLKQEEIKGPGAGIEDQDSLSDENADASIFSKKTGEAEHGDESSSALPVVGILQQLQNTLVTERSIKDSASSEENIVIEPAEQKRGDVEDEPLSGEDLHSIKVEPETLEKDLVTEISEQVTDGKHDKTVAEEAIEANKLQQDESGETEKIQQEEMYLKEEEKIQDSISREFEVNVEEKQQEQETRKIAESKEGFQAEQSLAKILPDEKILIPSPSSALPSEDLENVISSEQQEEHEEQQDVNALTSEKVSLQEEHPRDLEISARTETHETIKEDKISDIKEEKKNEETQDKKLEGLSITRDEEETFRSEVKKDREDLINEVAISEKQITEPPSEAQKQTNEEEMSQDIKEELNDDKSPNQVGETVEALITSENVQVQDESKDFEQEKMSNDPTYLQEDVKPEEQKKKESGLIEDKRETEDAIKHGVSTEEKNTLSEKTVEEETKEICQEESKQTNIITAIKEEMKEKEKETTPEMQVIENLSSVSKTQDISKQKDEVPNEQRKEIADEVPKIAEEVQQKESEPTVKEPARKSLSDLIQKVERTYKSEDTTTEPPQIEEEAKTEEDDEDGDEHKDDKGSSDSMVMVEAKETVSIIKTQHKKSQGILSGVGSKVKHSISKVKKVLTGKSSHTTTKPSSPPN